MAISAVTQFARVDLPPNLAGAPSGPNAPLDATAIVVEFTIQAADYSTGITYASIVAAIQAACASAPPTVNASLNLTTIFMVNVISVRVAAGTVQFGFGVNDTTGNKVRFFSAITNQTTATDYTAVNGDIWRCLIIGA